MNNQPTFSDLDGPRAVSGVEIYLLNEFNVVEEGDEGDEVGVRHNVGSTLAHLKTITMGIEDQLKKSKFLGHLPLHCLPFDFL